MTVLLTHGAGSNADAPLLVAVDEALAAAGVRVIRYTLPFRRARPSGPPRHGDAERDRASLHEAVLGAQAPIFLGGHSYGGRQSTILASENPGLVSGLLLLSYPLHPPRQPGTLANRPLPRAVDARPFHTWVTRSFRLARGNGGRAKADPSAEPAGDY